jgi:TonB family protein
VRPKPLEPSELALPKRVEKENPALQAPARSVERTLPPPPPVTPPATAPLAPVSPPRLPDPPRIAAPPAAPTAPAAPPTVASRPAEPIRTGRPTAAPAMPGTSVAVDVNAFPFTYYVRQLHAKVWERWRRPPLVSSEQAATVVVFEIDREGQIRGEPKISQSSGNDVYDQAALRAVLESVPFPPLPREFQAQYLKVNFGFNPGLDKS